MKKRRKLSEQASGVKTRIRRSLKSFFFFIPVLLVRQAALTSNALSSVSIHYKCVCVCLCICVRQREGKREFLQSSAYTSLLALPGLEVSV